MERIKIIKNTIENGNKDIAYLAIRSLKINNIKKIIEIDEKRLSNELNLFRYIMDKKSPSLISALIIIILSNKNIEDSFSEAIRFIRISRKKVEEKNIIAVNFLCHYLFNIDNFYENFSEYKMLDNNPKTEILFQKFKIEIILNKRDVESLIVENLDEMDLDFNINILKALKEDIISQSNDNMIVYYEKLCKFEASPKELEGDFNYINIINKSVGEKSVDYLLGEYVVENKQSDKISIKCKRGLLELSIKNTINNINNNVSRAKEIEDLKKYSNIKLENNFVKTNSLGLENSRENLQDIINFFKIDELDSFWKDFINKELEEDYFYQLLKQIKDEYSSKTIYPEPKNIFKAFLNVKYEDVKVVIIGQDPYHNPNQANGLCFSVNENVKLPPSLQNIFKEINNEYGVLRKEGNLEDWAKQGVLLLNSVLTVEENKPTSHSKIGWEKFTDKVVDLIAQKEKPVVFLLWGNYAIEKAKNINNTTHLILKSNHPSPLSASRGFFGNEHFKKTNSFLKSNNLDEINWV